MVSKVLIICGGICMIYGYARVSTRLQGREGNGLEAQRTAIINRYSEAIIFEEEYTGSVITRPVFTNLISKLKEGDTLVVSKLDRLARNTEEGISIVRKIFETGIAVHILNIGLLEDSPMGKFYLTVMLAVAELEKTTILERTQAGKDIARLRPGYREGRPPKFTEWTREQALSLLTVNGGDCSYKEVEKKTGISKSTIIREQLKTKTG